MSEIVFKPGLGGTSYYSWLILISMELTILEPELGAVLIDDCWQVSLSVEFTFLVVPALVTIPEEGDGEVSV